MTYRNSVSLSTLNVNFEKASTLHFLHECLLVSEKKNIYELKSNNNILIASANDNGLFYFWTCLLQNQLTESKQIRTCGLFL